MEIPLDIILLTTLIVVGLLATYVWSMCGKDISLSQLPYVLCMGVPLIVLMFFCAVVMGIYELLVRISTYFTQPRPYTSTHAWYAKLTQD
jgi:hypothetical protein